MKDWKNHINDFLRKNQDLPKSEKTETLDISIGIFACERTSFCLLSIQYEIGIMALHIGIGSLGTDKILGL